MKHIFIINPISGNKNPVPMLRDLIRDAEKKLAVKAEIFETKYKGNGTELAQFWAEWAETNQEIVRIYACGGDGTFNEVLSGVVGSQWVEVACVPCGSGNDFIKNFGTQEDFLNIYTLMQGKSQKIDLIKSSVGYSASICAAGLDAKVAYNIPKYRRIPFCGGNVAYLLSIIEQLCGKMGHKISIEVDGKVIQQECLLIAICNGTYYGGGFAAAPEATLDDGLLDVMIIKKISRFRIAKVLNLYKSGKHIQNGVVSDEVKDIIQFVRGKNIKMKVLDDKPIVVTVDGECSEQFELSAQVLPKAISICTP